MAPRKKTFEQALNELESVIEKLEGDELTLDEALSGFENGVKLIRTCDTHLKSAEGKLRELLKSEDGEFIEKVLGITLDSVVGGEEFDD
ncbi:MAG: exodeoxyribonuclease VII small subunit [Chitinivibrionales bacterium]|nr:exodeoxyribonuclease VII small subunit [Chitinivibrionales bacterium]MBD3355945.1 exodeoxyribonuclease VII small subunit [Chitinivibrionales bacterium]